MGAGSLPAGMGGAGFGPPYLPAAVMPVKLPRAVYYDPGSLQYVLTDANGNFLDMDPIDQIVATRWTVQQGQSGSVPGLGTQLKARFALTAPSKYPQIALDELTKAVADLVQAGDVRVVRVTYQLVGGLNLVQGYYSNLRRQTSNGTPNVLAGPQVQV